MEQTIKSIVGQSTDIVLIQADNPDGDSLSSSLALEQILSDLGKNVFMYCGTDIPTYLRHMDGWDRVQSDLPPKFDSSIIIDTSALSLLEQLQKRSELGWLKTKPCIVLDHHTASEATIDFASVLYITDAVSTGELIYGLSESLGWKRNPQANTFLMISIMSDSLGLTTEATTAKSIEVVSRLVGEGVSIPEIENKRREMQKKSPNLLKYKGDLLKRVEYSENGDIALITIPFEEIEKYSHEYNPSMLVLDEMRQVTGVCLAVAFKTYPDGRITAKLRANYGYGIAADVANKFGGGGHRYAAGFKIEGGKDFTEVKKDCIRFATELIDTLKAEQAPNDENTQYAYTVT